MMLMTLYIMSGTVEVFSLACMTLVVLIEVASTFRRCQCFIAEIFCGVGNKTHGGEEASAIAWGLGFGAKQSLVVLFVQSWRRKHWSLGKQRIRELVKKYSTLVSEPFLDLRICSLAWLVWVWNVVRCVLGSQPSL